MWWVLSTLLLFASTGSSPGDAVLPDPGNLVDYRGRNGETFQFLVRASTGGGAWGTDVYTDDSMLATAAVHAGALGYGETGVVEVTILPGGESYTGSMRYGVTTDSCGPWHGSYSVASIPGDEALAASAPAEKAAAWGMFIPVLAVSGAFWLLFSATSGRMGVLYRAYFNIFTGILAASATICSVLSAETPVFAQSSTSMLLFSLAIASAVLAVAGLWVARPVFPFKVSRHAAFVSSMSSAGIVVFWVCAFLLLGGPLSNFMLEEGMRESSREVTGTGISRRLPFGFYSALLPVPLFLAGLVNAIRVRAMRNRIAEGLVDPEPRKLRPGRLLLGLFCLVMFITISLELGLFRP